MKPYLTEFIHYQQVQIKRGGWGGVGGYNDDRQVITASKVGHFPADVAPYKQEMCTRLYSVGGGGGVDYALPPPLSPPICINYTSDFYFGTRPSRRVTFCLQCSRSRPDKQFVSHTTMYPPTQGCVKGTVARDFWPRIFFMNWPDLCPWFIP